MPTSARESQLNIRTTRAEKSRLAVAARLEDVTISQFVLDRSLDAADRVIAAAEAVRVSAAERDWLMAKLEEPPKMLPGLRELFARPSVFES